MLSDRMAGRNDRGGAGRTLVIALLVLVVVAAAGGLGYRYATGASGPSRPVTVDIPDGATAADVGDILQEAGVIRWGVAFRVAAGFEGIESTLQAGTYDLRTNMTVTQVLDALRGGPVSDTVTITFPEGLEVREVADLAASDLGLDPAAVEQAATSGAFTLPPYLPPGTGTVEGFLFPKTYEFPPEADADLIIDRLLQQFQQEAEGLPWQEAPKLGLTPYDVVIVASLVEREARVPADRPKIAAVIYNRIRRGMPLQIDATVQYALQEDNRILTFSDYKVASPYNTYLHPGLPPTPIASPGLASLRAALQPAPVDHLYFVVVDEQTGRHGFARTYQEFLRLKDRAGL
jgi:UPF0755 protein